MHTVRFKDEYKTTVTPRAALYIINDQILACMLSMWEEINFESVYLQHRWERTHFLSVMSQLVFVMDNES